MLPSSTFLFTEPLQVQPLNNIFVVTSSLAQLRACFVHVLVQIAGLGSSKRRGRGRHTSTVSVVAMFATFGCFLVKLAEIDQEVVVVF